MSSIENFTFINMTRSKPAPPLVVIKVYDRPGTDGLTWRQEAAKPKPADIGTKELIDTIDNANGRYAAYSLLKGQKVKITDDVGKIWDNVLVVDVDITLVQNIVGCSKPNIRAMVTAIWQVIIPEIQIQ